MKYLPLSVIICASVAVTATCQKVDPAKQSLVHAGFYTGRQYLGLATDAREIYASGLFDGLMVAGWMGAPEKNVKRIHDCIPSLTSDQFQAVLDRYLQDHPERLNVYMSVIVAETLSRVCKA